MSTDPVLRSMIAQVLRNHAAPLPDEGYPLDEYDCCAEELLKVFAVTVRGEDTVNPDMTVAAHPPLRVYVDDIRDPEPGWVTIRTSAQAIAFLTVLRDNHQPVEILSLDHDLGTPYDAVRDEFREDTTRPIVMWLCDPANTWWPEHIRIHSANVVAWEWLEGMIERYGPEGCLLPWQADHA